MEIPDYYGALGVPRDADAEQIKKAYRKLAMKLHPDRSHGTSDPDTEQRFKQVSEAYEVLSDPEKRAKYDALGRDGIPRDGFGTGRAGRPAGAAGPQSRQMTPEEFEQMFGGRGFSDFFAEVFGRDVAASAARAGGPQRHQRYAVRGADIRASIGVPVQLAIAGGQRSFEIDGQATCATCGGSGLLGGDHVCPACGGVGRTRVRRRVDVKIPAGIRDGQTLRLTGLGEPGIDDGPPGDLFITVSLAADDVYEPVDDDVYADVPIAPWEAALGAKVPVRTLDREVVITVPPGSAGGTKLRLAGQGLPRADGTRGDFFARLRIALPARLTKEQREILERLRDAGGPGVRGGARAAEGSAT